jgi:hypothetical protein
MVLNRTDSKSRIITMFLTLCIFLAAGAVAPARCEEPAVLKGVEAGGPSSVTPWTADYIRKRPT